MSLQSFDESKAVENTAAASQQKNNTSDALSYRNSVIKAKKTLHLIWAFFLPFGLMLAIYAALGTYPFGEESVLVLDLNGQYVYFFEALRDAVWGDGSLFYSFSRAMGGEFLGMYAYYLASPLSYLVALFPQHMILEALYLMLILKCGLSGFTFCYYLYKNNITSNKAAQVMFSCMYALSAYGVVMQHNTMWFDCVILLPIVALGIEKLIKERKYKMFTISLAICILSNFYIGYMVCIFVFIYFFFYYFSRSKREINPLGEKAHFIRSISRVGIFSAISVAISACILLPALYSLTFGKTTFSDPNYIPTQKFDFLDIISMLYPGSYDTVRPEGLPLVYCGLLAIIFLPVFFISKHITKREKIASGIIGLLFVLFFNMSTIDMFWHGMQRPNWLNYRYSFMLVFFILLFGCKAFDKINEINQKFILGTCTALGGILIIMQKIGYDNLPDFACVWLSIAFLCIYAVGVPLTIKSKFKITSTMILCVFVCLELFIAGLLNLVELDKDVVISSYDSYHGFIDKLRPIIDDVEESDDSFYRMEKNVHRKVNDPMALGIRGFSNSTSTLNEDTIIFLNNMGLASKSHWTKYVGATPVFDSLFGVKYLIAEEKDKTISPLYERYLSDAQNSYVAYKNPYALSIAYGVNGSIKDLVLNDPNDKLDDEEPRVDLPEGYVNVTNPFERINAIVAAMFGAEVEFTAPTMPPKEPDLPEYDIYEDEYFDESENSDENITDSSATKNESQTEDENDINSPLDSTDTENDINNDSQEESKIDYELFKPLYFTSRTVNAKEAFAAGHKKYSPSESGLTCMVIYTVYVTEDSEVFCYFPSDYPREVSLKLNGVTYGTYFGNETHRIINLGSFKKGDTFTLSMTLKKDDLYILYKSEYFFYLDSEVFKNVIPKLSENQFNITSYTEDSFEGTIKVTEGKNTIFTSIPYDKGWHVIVDGTEVETFEVLEALMAFDIPSGEHTIKMYYRSDSMVLGTIISVIGITVFLFIILFEKKLKILYYKIMPADRIRSTNIDSDEYIIEDSEIEAEYNNHQTNKDIQE